MVGIVQSRGIIILNKTDVILGLTEFVNYQKVKYTDEW